MGAVSGRVPKADQGKSEMKLLLEEEEAPETICDEQTTSPFS